MIDTYIARDLGYFAAAHNLPFHDGSCAQLHGHNYKVEITIAGSISYASDVPYSGMLIDFTHIKDIYKKRIHDVLDHAYIIGMHQPEWYEVFVSLHPHGEEGVDALLGKVVKLPIANTTAEELATWVFREMQDGLEQFIAGRGTEGQNTVPRVHRVRIYETETSYAETVER
jgi:6-pyruvoyltetrahydropterin/6-carboxytetrahydropterin synthase